MKSDVVCSLRRSLGVAATGLAAILLMCAGGSAQGQAATPALQYVPVITTYAGDNSTTTCAGAVDSIGDGCPASEVDLNSPQSGDADAAGNLYIPDVNNNVVLRVDAVTQITTVVAGEVGSTAMCSTPTDTLGDGCLATQAPLNGPRAVHFDQAGNMVIADTGNNVLRIVNKATGAITLLMGEIGKTTHTPPSNAKPSTPLTTILYQPYNFAFDRGGNLIVTNSTGDFIPIALAIKGLIDPVNSQTYDLAGTGSATGTANPLGDGGLATAATFQTPRGIAIDANENVFVADYNNNRVREISSPLVNGQVTPAGIAAATISTYAGNGTAGSTGDGGLATAAELNNPQGLGFDNAGNLYIAEYNKPDEYIRVVSPVTGVINTYSGTGAGGFAGDGGPSAQAELQTPIGLKFNLGNRFSIFDAANHRVRNSFATPFFSYQGVGGTAATQNVDLLANVAVTPAAVALSNSEFAAGSISGCSLGTSAAAGTYCTVPVTFTPAGPGVRQAQLLVTDSGGNRYPDSVIGIGQAPAVAFVAAPISTIAGTGTAGSTGNGGAATAARLNAPGGVAMDSFGNLYIADTGNNEIREIAKTTGLVSVVAGNGTAGALGDGAAATTAQLNAPAGVAVDAAGNLLIADSGNNKVREVSAATGFISTVAGTGTAGFSGDGGPAAAATLKDPMALAVSIAGNVYVADTGNNAVRAFSEFGGDMVTLAGTATAGFSGDGGASNAAQLNAPAGVAVDVLGNIYVADTGNGVVRRIAPSTPGLIDFQATIGTYAGTAGGTANSGDGGAATAATLAPPSGLGVDAAGDLYIAAGGQVRLVSAAGTISTMAGTGVAGSYSGEGGAATAAAIPSPASGLFVDPVGTVYVGDTAGNRVLLVNGPAAAALTFASQTQGTSGAAQTVTLYNSGNTALMLSNISAPANFAVGSGGANACTATTVLAAGEGCSLSISFAPAVPGNLSGQVAITDNALGMATATQSIAVSGVSTPPVAPLNPTTTTVTVSPASPVYGQTITLTATVAAGTATSGSVTFALNGTGVGTAPLNNAQATVQLMNMAAGTNAVTATYTGDKANAGSSGGASLTVSPAVLTVTATSLTKITGQPNPDLTYAIGGFQYTDTAASVVTGSPVLATTATTTSPIGTYPITISRGTLAATNYTFSFVPGTLTVAAASFSLTATPTSLTIPSGQVADVSLTLTPTAGYAGTVTLSCGTLPTNVLCAFYASSVALSNTSGAVTTKVTVSTDNYQHLAQTGRTRPPGGTSGWMMAFGVPLFWAGALLRRKRRLTLPAGLLLTLCLLGGSLGLSSCAAAPTNAAATSGTLTISATDGTITQTANVAYTIQ